MVFWFTWNLNSFQSTPMFKICEIFISIRQTIPEKLTSEVGWIKGPKNVMFLSPSFINSTELTSSHYESFESLEEGDLLNYLSDHPMTNTKKIQNKTGQMKSHVWSIMTPNITKFPPIHPMILFLRKSKLTHFDNFGLL